MHNNYYFLKQLVPAIDNQLKNAVLINCFSQNKDELIFEFDREGNVSFFLKAHLKNSFSCLSFPSNYHRAKKNTIDLFQELVGLRVSNLKMYKNERAFSINFNNISLVFKLFGNQSNIILFKDESILDIFKNNIKRDYNLNIKKLDRKLDLSFQNLKLANWNVRKTIPTLDKKTAEHLSTIISEEGIDSKEEIFDNFMKNLNFPKFYIDYTLGSYRLSLQSSENCIESLTDPIVAITSFFEKEVKNKAISRIKTALLSSLNGQLLKSNNYILKVNIKLAELKNTSSNQQRADILMANLHLISQGSKSVDLLNLYTGTNISIKLNPLQSPQKNAERYYRKSKNEAKEIFNIAKNIKEKEDTINGLNIKKEEIEKCNNLKTLQKWAPQAQGSKSDIILPYKEFTIDSYRILVGKNAKHNDTLTLKIAKKDDLWLHAKDVSGSHVVIKQIPGRNYPEYIIEKAAELAAFYSKRKTDSLCPVLYTPKKYVRKKKGTPLGAVFVEKEKVILVKPARF